MSRTIHVIGAGLSGLAAAIRLAEARHSVVVHEGTAVAGGRCRSYHDLVLGMTIDNGNHLLLSGNRAAMDYAQTIGTRDRLVGPDEAEFPFIDIKSGRRWVLRLGNGALPLWVFDAKRRVPDTGIGDYLSVLKLLWAGRKQTIGDLLNCRGPLFERLLQPLFVSALNVAAPEGSAALAGKIMRETRALAGRYCRPLVARDGLGPALVEPALEFLRGHGAEIRFEHQLHGLEFDGGRVARLAFGDGKSELGADDVVILAVPFWIATTLLPGLTAPTETRAILNGHFRHVPPPGAPALTGVVNGLVEWVFAFPDRIAITISNADRLMNEPREALAARLWQEVSTILGIAEPLPAWQIVRERRATFAAVPAEDAKRPGPRTAWSNLFLAGDWTDTGLPATIEGAIRSGFRAAETVFK